MSSNFMNAQTFQAKNDSEDVMKLMESNNSFSKDLRQQKITKNASQNLLNKYDSITQEQAMEILGGGMTEDETRRIVNDPRMKLWMIKNNVDISPANLDRFIQNRMVPNVRKITQSDPTSTSNITMKKYVGDDIQWRPKNASEKSNYAAPEETRLPQHVAQSGKGMIDSVTDVSNEYYRQYASKNLNNFQPIEKIQVGKATFVGGHYGHVDQKELARYDPGQQRTQSEFRDNNNIDTSKTKPTTADLAAPVGEIIKQENFEARKHIEYGDPSNTKVAQRNLFEILKEFQVMNTHIQDEPLMYDAKQLSTKNPDLLLGVKRDTLDTHDLNLRSVIRDLPSNFGVNYKQTTDSLDIGDRTRNERNTGNDSLQNQNILKNYSITSALQQFADPKKITNVPRQDLSENAYVPRQSHGGRLPIHENNFNNTRPDESLLYENNGGHGVRFQMNDLENSARKFDVTRESRNYTQESKYMTPGKQIKQINELNTLPWNTNKKSEMSRHVFEDVRNGSTTNSYGRPTLDSNVIQSSRQLHDEPNGESIKIDITTNEKRNRQKNFMTSSRSVTDALGDFDTTKNKRVVQERTGAPNLKQQYNIQLI